MKTKNIYYTNKQDFENFISKNSFNDEKNLMVQVFSAELNKSILQSLLQEIIEVIPHAKIIGSTTDGEILENKISTDKIVISVSSFEKATLSVAMQVNQNDSFECGVNIAKKLIQDDTKVLFLFSDGLYTNGEKFLHGVKSISNHTTIAGGMAGDLANFKETYIFSNDGIISNGVVGIAVNSKELYIKTSYNFNWKEIGRTLTITKAKDNCVYEIDGQSPIDIYAKYLGPDIADSLPAVGIEFPLVLKRDGIKIARAALKKGDNNSLIFAGNLAVGDKVQFGYGNSSMILKDSIQVRNEFSSFGVESIFVYSCMARRRFLKEATSLELTPIAKIAPTSGFFTYGEFFKANNCELLNQTMTAIAMSETNEFKEHHFEDNIDNILVSETSDTYKALSHLIQETTRELQETNENLENLVDEKTQDLEKKIQELEHASKVKSEFLASMSHEIRTPLNAILGFVDILKAGEKEKQRQKRFSIIKTAGASLLTIINDILDFSKIESGKMLLERRKFYTKNPFKDIAQIFYEKAKENGIELKIHFSQELPRYFVGDVVRIKQVAGNFLSNALKFTHKNGEINIYLKFEVSTAELTFTVKDNGIGINEKNLKNIFESFTQEDSTTTRKYGGTGLGLSISKALVDSMHGRIEVESTLGKGSKFSFILPTLEAEHLDFTDNSLIEKVDLNKQIDAKILLVEDNKTNQLLMKILLTDIGLSVDLAENGLEAVEKFKENQYNLILMDENMPKMSGIEATKIILDLEKQTNATHTPIVALTANALATDRAKFLSAGMDEFVSKPIDNKNFIGMLHSFLLK